MAHFTIYKDDQKIGTVLSIEAGCLYACFNRRFPQYKDTWGTPEQVRWSLRNMIPGARYEPLDLPRFDAFCAFTDGRLTEAQYRPIWNGAEPKGKMNI